LFLLNLFHTKTGKYILSLQQVSKYNLTITAMGQKAGLTFIRLSILFALQGGDISARENPVVYFKLNSHKNNFCVNGFLLLIPVISLLHNIFLTKIQEVL